MEYRLNIRNQYLGIPVKTASPDKQNLKKLDICCDKRKIFEFWIPEFPTSAGEESFLDPDYYAYLPVEQLKGRACCLQGDFPASFYQKIVQGTEKWHIDRSTGCISRPEEVFQIPDKQKLMDLYVAVVRGIVEITANHDIIYLIYETPIISFQEKSGMKVTRRLCHTRVS